METEKVEPVAAMNKRLEKFKVDKIRRGDLEKKEDDLGELAS